MKRVRLSIYLKKWQSNGSVDRRIYDKNNLCFFAMDIVNKIKMLIPENKWVYNYTHVINKLRNKKFLKITWWYEAVIGIAIVKTESHASYNFDIIEKNDKLVDRIYIEN
jgi:hypothetical protein